MIASEKQNIILRPGDFVEVRTPEEILSTLDANGTLDDVPFMPEMLEFCGNRYKVSWRVLQAVIDAAYIKVDRHSHVREFRNNDVVLLEGLRCSGFDHGECQRGCMIFWKEAWLRKVESAKLQSNLRSEPSDQVRHKFKTMIAPEIYFCQSTEFPKATNPISLSQRINKCFNSIRYGNYSTPEILRMLIVWTWWQIHHAIGGPYPSGYQKPTPISNLNLQPGEMVEVKSLREIIDTLDRNGRNRGLHFSPDMRLFCGKKYRVRSRSNKLITEGTGRMRQIASTVMLEGVTSDSAFYAFGGCPRDDFQYWREIWLRRI
jgi:hypothetical protein